MIMQVKPPRAAVTANMLAAPSLKKREAWKLGSRRSRKTENASILSKCRLFIETDVLAIKQKCTNMKKKSPKLFKRNIGNVSTATSVFLLALSLQSFSRKEKEIA
jgi:hypothetical protein